MRENPKTEWVQTHNSHNSSRDLSACHAINTAQISTTSKMARSNSTDSTEKHVNQALTTIAGSLSIFGTLAIFTSFVLCRELRTNSRRILVFISIGDFLTAIVNVSGVWIPTDFNWFEDFCRIQSFINIAAILSSFFWTVYLSVFLYLSLCGMRSESERKLMFVFHVTAWGIPLLVAIVGACVMIDDKHVFGQTSMTSDGWCWISHQLPFGWLVFWMVMAGKGWEILAYLAISVFYVKVKLLLKQKVSASTSTPFLTTASLMAARKADRKFTFIPIVFILLRLWGTVRFLLYLACLPECKDLGPQHHEQHHNIFLLLRVLHGIGDSSQGFANFLLFCLFTENIRYKIKFWCSKVCPCVKSPVMEPGNYTRFESTNAEEDH